MLITEHNTRFFAALRMTNRGRMRFGNSCYQKNPREAAAKGGFKTRPYRIPIRAGGTAEGGGSTFSFDTVSIRS